MDEAGGCRTCQRPVPLGAAVCPPGGAPQPDGAVRTLETCEIVLWRGYVKSGFVALPTEGTRSQGEPPASRLFRSKRNREPEAEDLAGDAHAELVERLLADEWEPVGRGSMWYAQRFARVSYAAAPMLDPSAVPPVPEGPLREPSLVSAHESAVVLAQPPAAPTEPVRTAEVERATTADRASSVAGHALVETLSEGVSCAEPVPAVTDLAPVATPSQTAGRNWRGRARVVAVLVGASVAGVIVAILPSLMTADSAKGHPRAQQVPSALANAEPVVRHAVRTSRSVRVMIAATRGDSWVEARADSATGRILYKGLLVHGQAQRVSGTRVWLHLAAASNLTVLVNGKSPRKPLVGTVNVILGPSATTR